MALLVAEQRFAPMSCVLREFLSAEYDVYASPETLVRPCSSKKLLISGLDTMQRHFWTHGWALSERPRVGKLIEAISKPPSSLACGFCKALTSLR